MAADRIQRAGAIGHDEVLIQIELFINGLHRTLFTENEQYNERYENMANQATVNLDRLRRSPHVSHIRFSTVERKLIESNEKIALLKEAQTHQQSEATGGEDETKETNQKEVIFKQSLRSLQSSFDAKTRFRMALNYSFSS